MKNENKKKRPRVERGSAMIENAKHEMKQSLGYRWRVDYDEF